jgi:hypothetical protein
MSRIVIAVLIHHRHKPIDLIETLKLYTSGSFFSIVLCNFELPFPSQCRSVLHLLLCSSLSGVNRRTTTNSLSLLCPCLTRGFRGLFERLVIELMMCHLGQPLAYSATGTNRMRPSEYSTAVGLLRQQSVVLVIITVDSLYRLHSHCTYVLQTYL